MSYEFKGTPGPWHYGEFTQYKNGQVHGYYIQSDRLPVLAGTLNWPDCAEANARAIAAVPELIEALAFAERRSKQPGEGHTEYFERIAEEFYHRHGFLAPGKDDPFHDVSEEDRRAAWEEFLAEPAEARRAALTKATGEQ